MDWFWYLLSGIFAILIIMTLIFGIWAAHLLVKQDAEQTSKKALEDYNTTIEFPSVSKYDMHCALTAARRYDKQRAKRMCQNSRSGYKVK